MCLYPIQIRNPKYLPNKKNKGRIPTIADERTRYVPIDCGVCIECRAKKARNWQVRMTEEIKYDNTGEFVTLTFSEESLKELKEKLNTEVENEIAKEAVKLFRERWRKKYKKSIKHWLVTELGHNGTERIHLHGILFTENKEDIEKMWGYGWVYIGDYVNEKTINYVDPLS